MSRTARVVPVLRCRTLSADADLVFDVLTDLEHVSGWLPSGCDVELTAPRLIRLWLPRFTDHGFIERGLDIAPRLRTVRWGRPTRQSHSGWVRVQALRDGRSLVTVVAAGPHDLSRDRLAHWLSRALDTLADRVARETGAHRIVRRSSDTSHIRRR